jgi:hypothetical protein
MRLRGLIGFFTTVQFVLFNRFSRLQAVDILPAGSATDAASWIKLFRGLKWRGSGAEILETAVLLVALTTSVFAAGPNDAWIAYNPAHWQ